MKRQYLSFRNIILALSIVLLSNGPIVRADTTDTKPDYDFYSSNDVIFYDPTATGVVCSTSGGSTTGSKYTSEQLKTFAAEPLTSTWNISDSTVEQWFLKQAGARATVVKYGLTSSTISAITSVVKAAGVSPIFFYLYTVTEGGGQGGFINHFGNEAPGGGPGNAKRDAEYLADYAKKMDNMPSWVDAGNPIDFVPQDVKSNGDADFKNMPSGSIGRVYIAATAAAAWEYYYPNGLKKEFNKVQDYGGPLGDAMQNIQSMGGDPMNGGTSVASDSCANGIMGEGMARGISWAKMIANNNGYGYDQPTRETGWAKWQSDPNCTNQCGSLDCSSFVSAILTVGGYFKTNPNFSTADEESALQQAGFTKVASSATSTAGLKPGDILHREGHTEMYIGNGQDVSADHNENGVGSVSGGKVGDQTGQEVLVRPFISDNWDSVWRAPN